MSGKYRRNFIIQLSLVYLRSHKVKLKLLFNATFFDSI